MSGAICRKITPKSGLLPVFSSFLINSLQTPFRLIAVLKSGFAASEAPGETRALVSVRAWQKPCARSSVPGQRSRAYP